MVGSIGTSIGVALAGSDVGPVPLELIADTLYCTVTPLSTPVSVNDVCVELVSETSVVQVDPPSMLSSILYPVIGAPPSSSGTFHDRFILPLVGGDDASRFCTLDGSRALCSSSAIKSSSNFRNMSASFSTPVGGSLWNVEDMNKDKSFFFEVTFTPFSLPLLSSESSSL